MNTRINHNDYGSLFLKTFIAHRVYTVCRGTNYKTVLLTNLNKYLHYGTSKIGVYVYKYRCKQQQ